MVVGEEIVDLTSPGIALPGDMPVLLQGGSGAIERALDAMSEGPRLALSDVRLLAPVPRPAKVLAIGLNYFDHIAELGREQPEYQYWFNKQRTCVVGPGAPVVVPRVSNMVDYEGELAMVVGRRCRYVPVDRALDVIAGFTVMNDVSVRDWQWRTPSFTMGKSFDTHGPMGPWVVTLDEVGDPQDLTIRTWVNGDLRQDSSTSQMIFSRGAGRLPVYGVHSRGGRRHPDRYAGGRRCSVGPATLARSGRHRPHLHRTRGDPREPRCGRHSRCLTREPEPDPRSCTSREALLCP